MRRQLIVLSLFCMLCLTINATADTLFPSLSASIDEETELAPSYSGFANVNPDEVSPYGDGGQVLTYNGVKENQYLEFGEYLASHGFSAAASNVEGRVVEMQLSNGKYNIGFKYDANSEIMKTIYEKGVDYEKRNLYPEYQEVALNQSFDIDDFGTLRIVQFGFGSYIAKDHITSLLNTNQAQMNTRILLEFKNKAIEDFFFRSGRIFDESSAPAVYKNNMMNIRLDYWPENSNKCIFADLQAPACFGEYISSEDIVWTDFKDWIANNRYFNYDFGNTTYGETKTLGVMWNLKGYILDSKDGTLAIRIIPESKYLPSGIKGYVLYLRKDGQKIGNW